MKLIEPSTPEEFKKYYQLRWEILRKPFGQPEGSEKSADEDTSIHVMVLDEHNNAAGVCRLHFFSQKEAQIRYMAVRDDLRGKGIGKQMLLYLENVARLNGISLITLQARENAVSFYNSMNYVLKEKTHKLFDLIQHYKMEKSL